MHVGISMFPTDYAIAPHELAVEAEARGYESLWLPEHSHIPTSRKSPWPGGAELPKHYYDTYEPFLSLAAAAVDFVQICFIASIRSRISLKRVANAVP